MIKPNPETCKNCPYLCAYHCAQLSYTTQHGAVLIIFPLNLQTSITAQILSTGGKGKYTTRPHNTHPVKIKPLRANTWWHNLSDQHHISVWRMSQSTDHDHAVVVSHSSNMPLSIYQFHCPLWKAFRIIHKGNPLLVNHPHTSKINLGPQKYSYSHY